MAIPDCHLRARLAAAIVAALLFVPTTVKAQATGAKGAPDYYLVTVKNCLISSDGGTTWVTLWTAGIQMDIASVAPLTKLGNFITGTPIAPGTYNRLRYTVDKTMSVRGQIAFGGNTYYTKNAASDSTIAPAEISTVDIPLGDQTFTQTISLAIAAGGATAEVEVDFNLQNSIQLYQIGPGTYKIYPEAPSTTYKCNGGAC